MSSNDKIKKHMSVHKIVNALLCGKSIKIIVSTHCKHVYGYELMVNGEVISPRLTMNHSRSTVMLSDVTFSEVKMYSSMNMNHEALCKILNVQIKVIKGWDVHHDTE